jgi:hypothetical protein
MAEGRSAPQGGHPAGGAMSEKSDLDRDEAQQVE